MEVPGLSYPLYDFTSSGLTHTWGMYWDEPNQYRIDSLIAFENYGIIKLNWQEGGPSALLEVRGDDGRLIQQTKIDY